jgi:hypothetical protein
MFAADDPAMRPSTVIVGTDTDALRALIPFHAGSATRILDVTYGGGTMWCGSNYQPLSLDIDPERHPDYLGSFLDLGNVRPWLNGGYGVPIALGDASMSVIVFDPPHLPAAAGSPKSGQGSYEPFMAYYGLRGTRHERSGDNVSVLFGPAFRQFKRVLIQETGIVLVKIADLVHNHRMQFQHRDVLNAAEAVGMTPCALYVKIDPSAGNMDSGRWENAYHPRNSHCYWIVIRNGTRCEP